MDGNREDQTLTCVQCGAQFVFSAEEQEFFEGRGLHSPPKRCKPCRAARRKDRRGGRRGGGGGRMKEYRGPAFRDEAKGDGVYRSPAFQRRDDTNEIYRSPAFRERVDPADAIYTAPGFREREGQDQNLYTAPAFRQPEHQQMQEGILPATRRRPPSEPPAEGEEHDQVSAEPSDAPAASHDAARDDEHDLELGPPPSYREPRSPEEIYRSPAFSNTDPAGYAPSYKRRQMHDIVCAECGRKSSVPFKPRTDRPVYCKDCFAKRKK